MAEPTHPEFNDTGHESDELKVSGISESVEEPVEAQVEEGAGNSTNDVMDLIASVEDQLEKMKSAQVNRSSEIHTLECRREELSKQEQEIHRESERLEALEDELETRLRTLVEREEKCAERAESMELMRGALESDSEDMKRREDELADLMAGFEEDKNEIVLEHGRLAGERAELEQARLDFGVEADRLKFELESALQAVADTESIRTSLEQQADDLREQHDRMMRDIEETNSRADSFKKEAESLKSSTLELASELESAAGVIDRLESERLALAGELQTCRSERDDSHESARMAIQERDEIKANLDLAMVRLQGLAKAVADQAAQFDEGALAISPCRELEDRMVTLSRELEEAHDQLNRASGGVGDADEDELLRSQAEVAGLMTDLDSCISLAEHEATIKELKQRIDDASAGDSGIADAEILEKLDEARCEIDTLETHARACEERIAEKERHLAELQSRNEVLESAVSSDQEGVCSDAQLLRDQAKRLSAFASHLQLRRVRLRKMRRILSERAGSPTSHVESSIESERLIRVEQEDMVRRRHEMAELESRMMRRWACHTTAGTVVKISILLVIIATACWFGTRWFAPGMVSSTALVRAHPITGGTLDDATAKSWNEWHKGLLSDDLFVKAVFNRFQSTSLGAPSLDASSAMLGDKLVVTEVEPGMLQIRLNGRTPRETQRLLESVVATLSSESQRQLARRGDGARVDIVTSDGSIVTNDPIPVSSGQFQTAGLAFGGSVAALGLFGAGVYAMLRRSRRIFDENIGIDSSSID